jgi:hypothetical protein
MQLHELNWEPCDGSLAGWKKAKPRGRRGWWVWHRPDGTYDIDIGYGLDQFRLDPLSAQCILYELLGSYNQSALPEPEKDP